MKDRLAELDWGALRKDLLEVGYAKTPALLSAVECEDLIALYPNDEHFRKRIDMERHTFGRGDYAYFARPLPALVEQMRTHLYPRLAEIANHWARELGQPAEFPESHREFVEQCRAAGQTEPTPLVLHYEAGGYNRLHQDMYGDLYFPIQVAAMLSVRATDYEGGEFLLLENRPRSQSRGHVVVAEQGELILFPTGVRPGPGARGPVRVTMRHGVATLSRGERYTLGIIFHESRS